MQKIRMGMVGGGNNGFIGAVHRMAAALDGRIELVCGSFSSDPARSRETGISLHLDASRTYAGFKEMMEAEQKLPAHLRMEFVAIVTPNNLHFEPALLALQHGFHVLCEKPLALSSKEALVLEKTAHETGLLFGVTYTYTGYPMVKEAREFVKAGGLGKIRKVIAEYTQGWLSSAIELSGQKQAAWRTDPAQAGISCCVGDIGTHAENLTTYITGLEIKELAADVSTFIAGRSLDDDASMLLRFKGGATGVILVSQVATGAENELKIRIYGEKGGLEWLQTDPNKLILKMAAGPDQVFKAGLGNACLSKSAQVHCRLPGGHPEGYIEAMANIYRNFAMALEAAKNGTKPDPLYDFPAVADGARGIEFIEAVIASGKNNASWIKLKTYENN